MKLAESFPLVSDSPAHHFAVAKATVETRPLSKCACQQILASPTDTYSVPTLSSVRPLTKTHSIKTLVLLSPEDSKGASTNGSISYFLGKTTFLKTHVSRKKSRLAA